MKVMCMALPFMLGVTACARAAAVTAPMVVATAPAPLAVHAAPSIDGIWLGALHVGPKTLRLQFHVASGASAACTMDSVDQHAFGTPCSDGQVKGDSVSLEVPMVHGRFTGAISEDGKTLTGTWSQSGEELSLILSRQSTALEPTEGDPAKPPVDAAGLQAVLDLDLAAAMKGGELASATGGGVTIGVVQHGVRRIFSYGTAKPDSVFEIGSLTKTFTGLILAQMVAQKKVRLDEPVRELLPPGTVAKPASGAEITLLDLSDQHSGLPRMPDNFQPADPSNPYVDYDDKRLYAFVSKHGVAVPAPTPFGYSNLGVGLLGQALADRAGVSYQDLLRREVTAPLGMHETDTQPTPDMRARFIAGHDEEHQPAHTWDWGKTGIAGCGAIRSTAADLLTYLEAQLHPDKLPSKAKVGLEGKTLQGAIEASHVLHGDAMMSMRIALGWFLDDHSGCYWHNGGTGGYSSFALFNPEQDYAVVVLVNRTSGADSFADKLGHHIYQRLVGNPAIPLGPDE